jgi:hypothetical protein
MVALMHHLYAVCDDLSGSARFPEMAQKRAAIPKKRALSPFVVAASPIFGASTQFPVTVLDS